MGVYKLLYRSNVPSRVRLQAATNVVCTVYMTLMTLSVTHISFFYIVPECFYGNDVVIFQHRIAIWYLFTSALGQYFTCIFTDTSAHKQPNCVCNGKVLPQDGVKGIAINSKRSNEMSSAAITSQTKGGKKRHCSKCKLYVPARTHHCYLCEQCILKRDHHCFFMGVCIGRDNHIYFIFFTLFMGFGTFYGMLLIAKYMYYLYGIQFQGPQTFLSLFYNTMNDLLHGKIPSIRYLALFILLYVSLAGTMVAYSFFFWQILIVCRGQTTYEASQGIKRFSKGSVLANFRTVFNKRCIVSLLVPFLDLVTDTNSPTIREDVGSFRTMTENTKRDKRKAKAKFS